MKHIKCFSQLVKQMVPLCVATTYILCGQFAHAQQAPAVGPIFVIDMENRNWTQPSISGQTPSLDQILGSPAAPFINSLVTPGNPNAQYVSYASAYNNVLAGPNGPVAPGQSWVFDNTSPTATTSNDFDIHPSEPNYLWQEAALNFSKYDDKDPYGTGQSVAQIASYLAANPTASGQHITGLLQAAGIPWATYQEDIDLQTTTGTNGNLGGTLTSTVIDPSQWTVPLDSFSGTSPTYTNPYNGSHQYNFAAKHDGTLFFPDTNGTAPGSTVGNTSTTNPEVSHYKPMQTLAADLASNNVAAYNLIIPDQYNDMHTPLTAGFTYNGISYTGQVAQIAQGDNFLAQVIPMLEASQAFQNNGVIIIWMDEAESVYSGVNPDSYQTTLMEIVISKLAVGNAYNVTTHLTHSADVATMQEIFNIPANTPTGYLNDAANPANGGGGTDLAAFFQPGVINQSLLVPIQGTTATATDIGFVGRHGSASFNEATSTYSLNGAGQGIGLANGADGFQFAGTTVSGDSTLIATVASQSGGDQSGIMYRLNLGVLSPYISVTYQAGVGTVLEWNSAFGTAATVLGADTSSTIPAQVGLVRSGDTFYGYEFVNGSWKLLGTLNAPGTQPNYYAGLVESSDQYGVLSTATFSSVQLYNVAY